VKYSGWDTYCVTKSGQSPSFIPQITAHLLLWQLYMNQHSDDNQYTQHRYAWTSSCTTHTIQTP